MITLSPIIGHRGAAALAPENTLASFRKAAELGVRWVEPDVHLTLDGELAVIHDPTLDRTTNGHGKVIQATANDLSKLDAGNGEPVPLLRHLLKLAEELSLGVNIELKGEESHADATILALTKALQGHRAPVLISSFQDAMMDAAFAALSHIPRGVLHSRLTKTWNRRAKALQASSIHLSDRWVKQRHVEEIKAQGYACAIYTVNSPDRAETLWSWGVDAIFSDLPLPMLELLDKKS